MTRIQDPVPDPPAYAEGFLQQDYDRVLSSLREAPGQAQLVIGKLRATLLHATGYDGCTDIATVLIGLRADVNTLKVNGRPPLHHAAICGH